MTSVSARCPNGAWILNSAGAQQLRQWELATEEAAADLQATEEELQEAAQHLLALQARCAESAAELAAQQTSSERVMFSAGSLVLECRLM